MTGLLKFSGVTLRRGGRLLFEGLDLDLAPGGMLHLGGPNGSGKSSLIRLAAGLLRAERGTVARADAALADDALALDAEQPLARALGFWGGLRGRRANIAAALDVMGLGDLADVPVRLLSAGQRKRASLARVAASRAPLWLLDEPANALDADGLKRLDAMIAGHVAQGGAVLAASHGPLGGTWARLELGA